jgi:membrane-bound lytic murein transglycosylase D
MYTTRRGDTLITVADRFDVTVEQLRRWNSLRGSAIPPGRRLYVSEPARISAATRSRHKKTTARSAKAASHQEQVHAEPKAAASSHVAKGKKTSR